MISKDGKKRVIITGVSPAVENGRYPAKAVIEENITLSADIFGDGHDQINASVFIRNKQAGEFIELPMSFIIND